MGQIRWTEASASPHLRLQPLLTPRFANPPVPIHMLDQTGAPIRAAWLCRAVRFPCRVASGESPVSEELTLGLKCRLCGKLYPKEALNFCTEDFGPLEVVYDYDAIGRG